MSINGDHAVGQLVDQLTVGFDSLSSEYRILYDQHRELENKLAWAQQQYLDLLRRFTPEVAQQDYKVFVQSLDEVERHGQGGPLDWLDALSQSPDGDRRTGAYLIRQGERAREQLKYSKPLKSPSPALKDAEGVKIWNGTSREDRASERLSKLESLRQAASAAGLERDFTTPGTPGKLSCPFGTGSFRGRSMSGRASMTPSRSHSRTLPHAMRSKRSSFNDPIRAELCALDTRSPEPSVSGSAGVCPIRFMDDHSPEEIAKYFENHKHQLPRSHEVCIKRFQSNSDSIRQLDAKYGDLVHMIQGLGEKHQPMLKEEPNEEAIEDSESNGRVANWAKAISNGAEPGGDALPDPEMPLPEEEERKPHFDRPLKDVRVGESPSRPWGISVPAAYHKAPSIPDTDPTASPVKEKPADPPQPAPKKAGKCPFDHTKMNGAMPFPGRPKPDVEREAEQQTLKPDTAPPPQNTTIPGVNIINTQSDKPSGQHGVVFTGPVFIGYPIEQAIELLKQTGFADKSRSG
ncbi:hypothetical protein IWZ01DRAFT_241324 [Phyllosticta capitalensis]